MVARVNRWLLGSNRWLLGYERWLLWSNMLLQGSNKQLLGSKVAEWHFPIEMHGVFKGLISLKVKNISKIRMEAPLS